MRSLGGDGLGLSGDLSHWHPEAEGTALREVTLGGLLAEQAAHHPDRTAIMFDGPDGDVSWTYARLDTEADRIAAAAVAAGLGAGERAAVLAPNGPEWVLLEYGLARAGVVLVTVNPAFRESEIAYLLEQGQVAALFTVGAHRGFDLGALLAAMVPARDGVPLPGGRFPALRLLVGIGPDPVPGALCWAKFAARADGVDPAALRARADAVRPEDVIQIQYTSGTTGQPKGAMLTHRGTVNNALLAAGRAGYRAGDVMVSAMPFFHTAGCVCNVMGMLAAGGTLVAMRDFDADRMLELMARHRATVTNAVPTMYVRLLAAEGFGTADLSAWRLAYVGGTSIPPSLMRELHARAGCEPVIIMGMTECSPIITQTRLDEPLESRVEAAGTPLPHVELRLADPATGATVPLGAEGELLIRGFGVTPGYFDMPERTAEAIDAEGWLRSGDLAVMDPGGRLRIIGRIKDMLIRGGENIYPVEIEDRLLEHPDIAEAQVVGVPDPEMGEEVFAFVVPRGGRALDGAALRDWCRARMARHKVPRHVAVIPETPKTANGKVRKVELREAAARHVAAIGEGAA